MRDRIAEKVMELYEKGVKQAVIAETLNIPKWKVSRIVNKKSSPASESEFTNEDYEAYEETLNGAPDDDPAVESASENPETPGISSEENSNAPDDDPAVDFSEDKSETPDDDPAIEFPSENPEIPGQPFDGSEQMKTIAEMTSAETARKLTDSYKEIFDLLGSANREIMENSMSGLDKGMRMLLDASERLNAISEKQEKQLASGSRADLHPERAGNYILYLVLALLHIFAAFCFGGICGICDMLYFAVALCGFQLAAIVMLLSFYLHSGGRKTALAFIILAVAAAIPALISGYFFFLVEKSIMRLWLYSLSGVLAGGLISLLYFLFHRKLEKVSK